MMKLLFRALIFAIIIALPRCEPVTALELHGVLQNNASLRMADYGGREHDWLNLETKLQVETRSAFGDGKGDAFGKIDFDYSHILGSGDVEVRELYVNRYFSKADIRIGKQIITWGSSDLVFVTDVFPKDWTSLIVGRPMEYLKKGTEAARGQFYLGKNTLEIILIPAFTPDTLPGGERLAAYNPFQNATGMADILPPNRLRSPEAAIAVSKTVGPYDYSLNFYSGRDRRPALSFDHTSGMGFRRYPRMWMIGGGFKGASGDRIYRGEIAYYHTEDTSGADPGAQNASLKYLLGTDISLGGNRSAGFQFSQEFMFDYGAYSATLPAGFPTTKKVQSLLTFRFMDAWKYQTIKPKLFLIYDISGRDFYLNCEYEQNLNDAVSVVAGFNQFGGRTHTMYGQFEKNDNAYLNIRHGW